MLKSITVVIIFIFSLFIVNAQLSISPYAGILFSNFRANADGAALQGLDDEYDLSVKPAIGVMPEYRLSNKFSTQIQVQYGFRTFPVNQLFNSAFDKHKINSIELAPAIKFHVNKGIGLFAGIKYGRITTERTRSGSDEWIDSRYPLENKNQISFLAGLELNIKPIFVFLQLAKGLNSLDNVTFTDELGVVLGDASYKLQDVQLGIGYRFVGEK